MKKFFYFQPATYPLVLKLLHSVLSLANPTSPLVLVHHWTHNIVSSLKKRLCNFVTVDPLSAALASDVMFSLCRKPIFRATQSSVLEQYGWNPETHLLQGPHQHQVSAK
jgi:hypothetical protein